MMIRFIRWYALEIYTVISLVFLTCAGISDNLSFAQKAVMVYTLLFVFHEWEEGRYPGGFLDKVVGKVTGVTASEELKRASRIPTGILLLTFSMVPYFFDNQPLFLMVATNLCVFEGLIHIIGIKLANLDIPYTPGMVTAELELIAGIYVYAHLSDSGLLSVWNILLGILLFIVCFIAMQRSLLAMAGKNYGYIVKTIKSRKK
ncbi:MAG: hypothetical protein IJR38_00120 [Selenomonadaceae bacterium]|nr:hypothetical protein [Selenomonadaceae bacterium]